jgi:hypothetical protein
MNISSAILKLLGLYANGETSMAKLLGIFLQLGSANASKPTNTLPVDSVKFTNPMNQDHAKEDIFLHEINFYVYP